MSDEDVRPRCVVCCEPAVMSYGWIGQESAPWYCVTHMPIAYERMERDAVRKRRIAGWLARYREARG